MAILALVPLALSLQNPTLANSCVRFAPAYLPVGGDLLYSQSFFVKVFALPFTVDAMVVSPEIMALYTVYDFIPQALMDQWAVAGFTVGAVFEWLLIPVNVARAVFTAVGS